VTLDVAGASEGNLFQLRDVLTSAVIGDTVRVGILRGTRAMIIPIAISGFDNPEVRIGEVPSATARQRALREKWLIGAP